MNLAYFSLFELVVFFIDFTRFILYVYSMYNMHINKITVVNYETGFIQCNETWATNGSTKNKRNRQN